MGQTFFEYRDKAEDILSHLSEENLLDQSLGIDFDRLTQHGMNTKIIINTGNCDPSVEGMLQTLLHEYGVHAMEWVHFIQNILPQSPKKEKGWCGCPWCFITTACNPFASGGVYEDPATGAASAAFAG